MSIDGFEDVPKSDEAALRKAVSQQPVSVAICASELQFYFNGGLSFFRKPAVHQAEVATASSCPVLHCHGIDNLCGHML